MVLAVDLIKDCGKHYYVTFMHPKFAVAIDTPVDLEIRKLINTPPVM